MSVPTPPITRKVRLAFLVSHPIQYQAPLLRRLAQEPDIELTVFFGSDFSLRGYVDKGFGVEVAWDTPLVAGYRHEFLPVLRDNATVGVFSPMNYGIFSRFMEKPGAARFDAIWVHGYASFNAIHAMLAAKALGIPVLLRADSSLKDRPRSKSKLLAKRVWFKLLSNLIDGVLTTGTLNAQYWRHYLGDGFPAWLLPYAVDNDFFQRRSREGGAGRAALQAELGLDPARPVILFASKLQERKRCIDLLEAYLRLPRQQGLSEQHDGDPYPYLVIVGDGEQRAALEARAAHSQVKSIRFCGFRNQSELPRFFDLAMVFVLPSRHEPWGLIVNEAMNAGKPVIVSDEVGCQPDLVRDGIEGCVFPARDIAALANALQRVLDNPDETQRMGERALERIQHWSFEQDIQGLRAALAAVTRKLPP